MTISVLIAMLTEALEAFGDIDIVLNNYFHNCPPSKLDIVPIVAGTYDENDYEDDTVLYLEIS